ncbi:MAG: DUF599 domain-containing protein [Deltaproteobacteria bacterium]|nr:DUF599 domain-containing protein [Deltaproteobacteria bacterium]
MNSWPEIIITSAGFLTLLIYHIHLVYKVKTAPMSISIGLTNHLRREWVQTIMEKERDILAVQTIRNWVMASSFLASAAILIGLGVLNAAFGAEKSFEISQSLNLFGTKSKEMWLIKLMLLAVDFFFAFFNFALSIRYYTHASFAINIPPSHDPTVTYDAVTKILNRGATHYTLGMRGYYLAVPFTLWMFGPTWMAIGTAVLIIILYKLDRMA